MHMTLEGVSDHDAVPRKSDAEKTKPVQKGMGTKAKRKRVLWDEPSWLQPLLDEALRCVPDLNLDAARHTHRRQAACCSTRLVAQVLSTESSRDCIQVMRLASSMCTRARKYVGS
eukprot:3210841-Amphidinium_carterae.1